MHIYILMHAFSFRWSSSSSASYSAILSICLLFQSTPSSACALYDCLLDRAEQQKPNYIKLRTAVERGQNLLGLLGVSVFAVPLPLRSQPPTIDFHSSYCCSLLSSRFSCCDFFERFSVCFLRNLPVTD